ncbi:MAG: nucleotidyltransferase domain-containing protein [Euryarchaeota archaeon]|nr:nucleotidyltransferase domain-containing protein [Euryarchaeota archaeon]MDE1838090.1 nucleotidyltransferase domain-containing protein [Euryarchaeota archaeon]MDE1881912.1 nucleotidyltransferase domain-containing protein [Euryarchaeota archaeon]MDE2046550.1 nucleotidyltransferase domain-containing protein [Thermoplasmata archaeon]
MGIDEVIGEHRRELLRLASVCRARNVRVFGSVRRREANAGSDVDLLVEWDRKADLLDIARFRIGVRKLLHRKVDVVEESRLHWAVRPQVVQEAVAL